MFAVRPKGRIEQLTDEERPLCECHGRPMRKSGKRNGKQNWCCAVKASEAQDRYNRSDRGRLVSARYNRSDKKQEYWRSVGWRAAKKANNIRLRESRIEAGMCAKCGVRKPEALVTKCVRCQRYESEHGYLGYSTIPLAKGSEG